MAVAKVSGENPMEGIIELRAMADETPPNLDAVMWLGRFSRPKRSIGQGARALHPSH